MPLYKHKFHEQASDCVKYRGETNQIDIIDSIIAVLSKYPGLTGEQVAAKIFPPELGWSRKNVIKHLEKMSKPIEVDENACEDDEVEVPILAFDGEFYYLFYDAMTHDIGKTKEAMERLQALGLSAETINFISGGIIAYADEVKEGKHKQDNVQPEEIKLDTHPFTFEGSEKSKLRAQAIADLIAEREEREIKEQLAKEKAAADKALTDKLAAEEKAKKDKQEAYNRLPAWKKLLISVGLMKQN